MAESESAMLEQSGVKGKAGNRARSKAATRDRAAAGEKKADAKMREIWTKSGRGGGRSTAAC